VANTVVAHGKPMYFEIQGTNIRLCGSMHGVPAGGSIPMWVTEAYDWSEDIYLEADAGDLPQHAFLPSGQSSESRLTPALWAAIEARWPPVNGALGSQKPWLIAIVLATSGLQLLPGVENLIRQRTQADARTIKYLESVGEFAELLDGISNADYERSLALVLDTPDSVRAKNIADTYQAWISGQADAVTTVMQASPLNQFPAIRTAVFDARNALWLPRIIEITDSPKRTVIFVGAGHLGGTNGVLALLTRAGYQLTPLLK
jgi:uncharacterized protein YbaP (TraB family)